ncbi:MAG: FAD-dependent oxidoreductase [Kiritimatiellaeota bacterium]|nr:FAD-dependent oxidoreductase [Kiritimatiellota bacterium]
MKTLNYSKSIPVKHTCDVLVAGGGPAGIAAAVYAARRGAKVRVIEAGTCLGGLGTAGMVPAFTNFTDGVNFLAGGFGRELCERLEAIGGFHGAGYHCIKVEPLKRLYERMFEEEGVEYSYHTKLIDVRKNETGANVTHVVCAAKSGVFAIGAKAFVDGTGDGDLCVLAGASFVKGDASGAMMPGTLCTLWGGIDWDIVRGPEGKGYEERNLEPAISDGVFTLEDRHLPGMWRVGEKLGGGNIGHTFGVDGTDEDSLTKAYAWGRKSILEYERFYKNYLRGYENMELVVSAQLLGVRETRRITCDYELNFNDFNARAIFDDEIGRYSYPIDIHIAKPDKASFDAFVKHLATRLGHGESYGLPYRSLTPRGLDNVWVAGRCIGTDREMQASIRVMPCCFITGQAVGLAAAMCADTNLTSRTLPLRDLQSKLKHAGAFLPNLS